MGVYRPRSYALFDPTKPLVAGRQMTLNGKQLDGGDPIDDPEVDEGIKRQLWMIEHAHYKDDYTPTPEMAADPAEDDGWMEELDGVRVEAGENGYFTIHAGWLGEGEKVHGRDAAITRAAEVRQAGDTKGVTYAHTGGGWYEVKAPWLEEPVKVKGEDAAKAKAAELRDQAPNTAASGEGGGGGDETGA